MISLILMILVLYGIYKYGGWPGVIGFVALSALMGVVAAFLNIDLGSSSWKSSSGKKSSGGYSIDELEEFDMMDEDDF